ENVQQALGRVLVGPVAGVDDAARQVLGQEVRGPGGAVAHHDDVHAHRLDVLGGVDERLALADAGAGGGEVDGVGGQALGGEAEAGAGAGGRLEEEVDDDLSLEVGALLAAALTDLDEVLRRVEDGLDLAAAQVLEAEEVTAGPHDLFRF